MGVTRIQRAVAHEKGVLGLELITPIHTGIRQKVRSDRGGWNSVALVDCAGLGYFDVHSALLLRRKHNVSLQRLEGETIVVNRMQFEWLAAGGPQFTVLHNDGEGLVDFRKRINADKLFK